MHSVKLGTIANPIFNDIEIDSLENSKIATTTFSGRNTGAINTSKHWIPDGMNAVRNSIRQFSNLKSLLHANQVHKLKNTTIDIAENKFINNTRNTDLMHIENNYNDSNVINHKNMIVLDKKLNSTSENTVFDNEYIPNHIPGVPVYLPVYNISKVTLYTNTRNIIQRIMNNNYIKRYNILNSAVLRNKLTTPNILSYKNYSFRTFTSKFPTNIMKDLNKDWNNIATKIGITNTTTRDYNIDLQQKVLKLKFSSIFHQNNKEKLKNLYKNIQKINNTNTYLSIQRKLNELKQNTIQLNKNVIIKTNIYKPILKKNIQYYHTIVSNKMRCFSDNLSRSTLKISKCIRSELKSRYLRRNPSPIIIIFTTTTTPSDTTTNATIVNYIYCNNYNSSSIERMNEDSSCNSTCTTIEVDLNGCRHSNNTTDNTTCLSTITSNDNSTTVSSTPPTSVMQPVPSVVAMVMSQYDNSNADASAAIDTATTSATIDNETATTMVRDTLCAPIVAAVEVAAPTSDTVSISSEPSLYTITLPPSSPALDCTTSTGTTSSDSMNSTTVTDTTENTAPINNTFITTKQHELSNTIEDNCISSCFVS